MSRELIAIIGRHGSTKLNSSNAFRSMLDPELDESGIADADKLTGCACDAGYSGALCEARACPLGDDPLTTGQADEVQLLRCSASALKAPAYAVLHRNLLCISP